MKIMYCPQCGGKVRCESIGWRCERCRGFIDIQGGFYPYKEKLFIPTKTNADRIRAMDDEQLAKFLCEFRSCDYEFHPCNNCKGEPYCRAGHNGMIDWLKEPAGEDTDEH